jgi:predicted nucleic acid-binding protein
MESRRDRLVTSALTIGEILVRPIRKNDSDSEQRYRAFFSDPEIRIAAFDAGAAQFYARVRQDAAVRVADAIQLACAASAKVDLFVTNDERLSRKQVPGINFITSLERAPI